MPRFAANLSFLFQEIPFLDRFAAAAASGFQAVEYDNRFFVNPGSATGAWIGNINGSVFSLSQSSCADPS